MNIGIIGASGTVGRTILQVLEERNFNVDELYLFSSKKSAGETITFNNQDYTLEELEASVFDRDIDVLFFAAGGAVSEKFIPLAKEKGIVAIDNSSVYRMDENVPLIVPEVNRDDLNDETLIANPNCSTIQSVVALKPLQKFGIKRITYTTYQAVSGSGVGGIEDLKNGTTNTYQYNIQQSVLPHIDVFLDNGYTKEEMKMIEETKKILNDDQLKVTATTVRVPIENGHAVNIDIEFEQDFDIKDIYEALEEAEGVVIKDDIENLVYPITEDANGTDDVYVGRIRRDYSTDNGIHMFVTADNIRKGAATNSVQIAEILNKGED